MGSIIRPELVKKRETSLPRSASRAIVSARAAYGILRVFLIKFSLLRGGFPQSYQVVVFALTVFAHLENKHIEPLSRPTYSSILLRKIRALIKIIRMREDFPRLLKTDATLRIRFQPLALSSIKIKTHDGI